MMEGSFTYETYLSPFTWRYGSDQMRRVWSEEHRRLLWRRIWVALARAQMEAGLVTEEELADLEAHQAEIDIPSAHQIEAEIRHDLMAEVRTFAEQCPLGGGKIHLGATSMDIQDNADILRVKEALALIRKRLAELLRALAEQVEEYAGLVAMGYTHLQPAEPTTIGYRLAQYAQDLLFDYQHLEQLDGALKGKGIKGAVGTSASYDRLLAGSGMTPEELEEAVMAALGLEYVPISTQTYPRKFDLWILNALAGLAQSLHRFGFDLRVLQSPGFGEMAEPFGRRQVGSSAMPFKRDPEISERICSLARLVGSLVQVAWGNAASTLLERTLDDSANRRSILAEAFLAADEMVLGAARIVRGLRVNEKRAGRNLRAYGLFAATEVLLMEAVKAGANRQEMHEVLREHSMRAWEELERMGRNPLVESLGNDGRVTRWVKAERIPEIMRAEEHIGRAREASLKFAQKVRSALERGKCESGDD